MQKEPEWKPAEKQETETETEAENIGIPVPETEKASETEEELPKVSGTLYAINGDIQKLGGGIFLCTPNNVNVEGKISDDNAPTPKSTKPSKKSKVDDEEDEFNW